MNNISHGNYSNPLISASENFQEDQNNNNHAHKEVTKLYIGRIKFLMQECLPENGEALEKLQNFVDILKNFKESKSLHENYLKIMLDAYPALVNFCGLIPELSEKERDLEISDFTGKINHSGDLKQILEECVNKISTKHQKANEQPPRALYEKEKQVLAQLAAEAVLNDSKNKAPASAATKTDFYDKNTQKPFHPPAPPIKTDDKKLPNDDDYAIHQVLIHLLNTKDYESVKNSINNMNPAQLGLPDENGDTALIILLKNAQFDLVKNHLINKLDSTQLRHKNNAGQTALDVMKDCHRPKLSQLLAFDMRFFASFFNWYFNPSVWSIWLRLPGNN